MSDQPVTQPDNPTPDRTADEAALRQIVQNMAAAWNQGDGAGFAADFVEDGEFMAWNGIYAEGKEKIASAHTWLLDTIFRDSVNQMTVTAIRFLRQDVALVRAEAMVTLANGRAFNDGVKPLFVMSKEAGRWQIVAFQNTPIVPMPNNDGQIAKRFQT